MVRLLFLAHRYLGIAVGLVMLIWTVSGIIMMYQEYPELDDQEQRSLLSPLRFAECCELPARPVFSEEGFRAAQIEMSGGVPTLRLQQVDGRRLNYDLATGREIPEITQQDADLLAVEFAYRQFPAARFQFDSVIRTDQWTVYGSYNRHRPLYRYTVQDDAGSEFYISSRTGEIVQLTTRQERVWGYLGAVLHWLYPTILRQHTTVWAQTVIWLTILGIFLTSIGLYIGIRQYRQRSNGRHSPYRGMALWHHYTGLAFGVLTLTWVFSGLFSMNPWGALEGEGIGPEMQRLTERPLAWQDITAAVNRLQATTATTDTQDVVRYELSVLAGAPQIVAYRADGFGSRLDYSSLAPLSLSTAQMRALADRLQPDETIVSAQLIGKSDAYYYDHHVLQEFPVYRVEFADDESRRYYLSAVNGTILRKVDRDIRWYRWLFYGLHRGDFTTLLRSRPLWDLFMVTFLLGVTAVCATGTVMAWRRVKRDLSLLRFRSLESKQGKRADSAGLLRKSSILLLAALTLSACSEQEAVDWIEVPLEEATFFPTTAEYREGEYDILVLANADLEYKLGILGGDAINYRWTVDMSEPERLNVEFHGHTHREGDEPGTVMFYKIHQDGEEQGALVAPFDGIHGWWFDNQTNEDITIKLQVAGFYEEIDE